MTRSLIALILCACLAPLTGQAEVSHYPAREVGGATLVIYGATDLQAFEPLIIGFQDAFPTIAITYYELDTNELYERFLEHAEEIREDSPDLLLSSAMDLQMKLVNDGYALNHDSEAVRRLPHWAVWGNEAFGFSFEPVVIVYNNQLVPKEDIPYTRAALAQLLRDQPDRYFGKVATYDPQRSGVGFLLLTQDAHESPFIWDLARILGASGVKLYSTTSAILDRIASGEFLIGYNLLGSYAWARARANPSLGIVLPRDYTLVMSRIALIPTTVSHPEFARLFLDFLLSKQGQRIVAGASHLYSIHPEVTGKTTAEALRSLAANSLRPIPLGPGLLVYLDQVKRQKFLKRWERALGGR